MESPGRKYLLASIILLCGGTFVISAFYAVGHLVQGANYPYQLIVAALISMAAGIALVAASRKKWQTAISFYVLTPLAIASLVAIVLGGMLILRALTQSFSENDFLLGLSLFLGGYAGRATLRSLSKEPSE